MPALYAALKSLTLADAGNVHKLADLKVIHQHAVAGLGFVLGIFDAKFAEIPKRSYAGLFEMTRSSLVHALRLDEFHQTQLHGIVAIFISSPPLNDHTRTRLQNGARNGGAVFSKHLRHT